MEEKEVVEIKAVSEVSYDYVQLAQAIARFVVAPLFAILTAVGISVDVELTTTILTAAITLAAYIWAWWKNNNVTTAAQIANDVQQTLKVELKQGDEKVANAKHAEGDER